MNYINFYRSKILSFFTEAKQIKENKMPIPRMALFCPSYACDLKCYYCDYPEDNKTGKIIDKDRALALMGELADAGVRGIDFCGGGEPLLTPYALDLLKYIKMLKMEFGIISNGTHFSGDLMKYIVEEGKYIRISFDSIIHELYTEMKGVDKCLQVFENIKNACEYKKKVKGKCQILVRIGLTKKNATLMNVSKTMMELMKLDIDGISFKIMRECGEEIDKNVIASIQEYVIQREMAELVKGSAKKVIFDLEKTTIDRKCWLSPIHTTIMGDGNVYLCCYFQNRKKDHCFGNILDNSFKSVWLSKEHKEAIEKISIEVCNRYDCKYHIYNKVMDDFLENADAEHI